MKKTGQKNELSKTELDYFESLFGNRYKIKNQLGKSGCRTSAYLVEDENKNEFVLKISNDEQKEKWLENQKSAMSKRDQYCKNYNGNILIPKTIEIKDNCIIEEFAGSDFTEEVYQSLSKNEQISLAQDFAEFLNFTHQQTVSFTPENTEPRLFRDQSFENVLNYLKPVLSDGEFKEFTREVKRFKNEDFLENFELLTFQDFRSQNLLYNASEKRLSIIDFEMVKKGNVYHDFVPYAPASFKVSYDFLNDVITFYNKAEKKTPLNIDRKKVALLHSLGVVHEFGRVALFNKSDLKSLAFVKGRMSILLESIKDKFADSNENTISLDKQLEI